MKDEGEVTDWQTRSLWMSKVEHMLLTSSPCWSLCFLLWGSEYCVSGCVRALRMCVGDEVYIWIGLVRRQWTCVYVCVCMRRETKRERQRERDRQQTDRQTDTMNVREGGSLPLQLLWLPRYDVHHTPHSQHAHQQNLHPVSLETSPEQWWYWLPGPAAHTRCGPRRTAPLERWGRQHVAHYHTPSPPHLGIENRERERT